MAKHIVQRCLSSSKRPLAPKAGGVTRHVLVGVLNDGESGQDALFPIGRGLRRGAARSEQISCEGGKDGTSGDEESENFHHGSEFILQASIDHTRLAWTVNIRRIMEWAAI